MKRDQRAAVRALLRAHEDGLTATDMAAQLGEGPHGIRRALSAMPDVYIDRWVKPARGPYAAVWCAVPVPENCPRPSKVTSDACPTATSPDQPLPTPRQ